MLLSFCVQVCEDRSQQRWGRLVTVRKVHGKYVTRFNELSLSLSRRLAVKLCQRYGIEDQCGLFGGVAISTIKSGTGTRFCNGDKYRYANYDCWRVVYYPETGGAEGLVNVPGIGWCVDTYDDMPDDVWNTLLATVGGRAEQLHLIA